MNEDNTEKLRKEKRPNETMEWRLSNIEKHNQIRRIESADGLTYFDTELGEFKITNASGSITWTAGQVIYKDANGNTTRISTGSGDTYYDTSGNVTRIVTGTKDGIFDGDVEVARYGELDD